MESERGREIEREIEREREREKERRQQITKVNTIALAKAFISVWKSHPLYVLCTHLT